MKFCAYHQTEHDEDCFNATQLKRKNSAWCRQALAENKRLKSHGLTSNSKATGKGGRPRWDTQEDRQQIKAWLDSGQSYSWIGRQYDPPKQASVISKLAKEQGWDSLNVFRGATSLSEAPVRVCMGCKQELPIDQFPLRTDRKGKRHAKCKTCRAKEVHAANQRTYYKNHQQSIERARTLRLANPEKYRALKAIYDDARRKDPIRQEHWRQMQRVHQANRRAREVNAAGVTTLDQRQARIDYYGGMCSVKGCGKAYEHIDHAIPLVAGGTNWPSNLYPMCQYHNLSKSSHKPILKAKYWQQTGRNDPACLALANRHYSRRNPNSKQFVQPCKKYIVLKTQAEDALWVSVRALPEYVRHEWPDNWFCQIFRNEGPILSSLLVKEAVSITLQNWRDIPAEGFITFVDAFKTRKKRDPGRCFRKAGFEPVGYTKGGLVVLQLAPENFPLPKTVSD